jgi:hypothetical protein
MEKKIRPHGGFFIFLWNIAGYGASACMRGRKKRKSAPSRGACVRFSFLLVGIFEGKILRPASSSRRREKWNKALKKNEAFFEGGGKELILWG